ncbi:MFS transporter [Rhodococcus fascians]|nr:MFS transporter [Rhodococcus fascians]MBY4238658.1 MFS transporter [Rhodococcus fascians]MBY4254753.1 MFS transporter [Rhodococcus fascians]MBY4270013.1 MFS transporter [Rhodococcus fascians]
MDNEPTRVSASPGLHRKVAWRVLPLVVTCYLFAYIDRINIGFAKEQISTDVGLTEAMFGFGAGIFFIGYVIFEVPSNLLMTRIGARKTFTRILVLWGITSVSMVFVRDPISFYALRFLLGVFEAGFAPGMILFATYWFPRARMATVMGILMIPSPLGSMIGAPMSSSIIYYFDGIFELSGWQWMFIIEGIPCIILAVFVWKTLADNPRKAKWLTETELAQLTAEIEADKPTGSHSQSSFSDVLTNPRVYAIAACYFAIISAQYAIAFYLPTIIKESGGITSTLQVGLWAAIPFAVAIPMMQYMGRRSDRHRERHLHAIFAIIIGAVALFVAAIGAHIFILSMAALVIATAFIWSAYTVFWAIPSSFLSGSAAAGGIAFINSIGLLGGFFAPTLIGYTRQITGASASGLIAICAVLVVGAIALFFSRSIKTIEPIHSLPQLSTPANEKTTIIGE